MANGEREELGLDKDTVEVDYTIDRSRGSADGYIVMAEGDGIDESIGCEFKNIRALVFFMELLEKDPSKLDEFMPDSDWRKVERLYID